MQEETVTEKALYSEEAERAVVGCMFVCPEKCCEIAIERLEPADFFVKSLRSHFVLLSAMFSRSQPIDVLTVGAEAKAANLGTFDEINSDIVDAITGFPKMSSFFGYVEIVKSKARDRTLQDIGFRLIAIAQGFDDRDEKDAKLADGMKRLDELTSGVRIDVVSGPDPWDEFYRLMSEAPDEGTGQVLTTGYGHFDEAVKVRGGQVIVIAAVQKQGKSSLALNMAVRWWSQQIPGCVCSLETGRADLQTLIMANVTGIARDHFEARGMEPAKLAVLFDSTMKAKGWPYAIYDRPSLKVKEFRALAREQARKGAKFIVLDYFQLLQSDRGFNYANPAAALEENMRAMKTTAMETGLAVILLSQLNTKQVDGKQDNRPTLAHLRGTGAIAQDADVVMLLSEPYPQNRPNGMRQLVGDIAANRRGVEKDINWLLDGAHARFLEC
jgi:replicative DNA helicase